MKSQSSYSCLGSALLLVLVLVIIRYALPAIWKILAGLFTGAVFLGLALFLILIAVLGYVTYKNLSKNKQKAEARTYAAATRVEVLYRSIVDRLHQDMALHQITAEELLQSEILITEHLARIREDLVRLKEFASPRNQKELSIQERDYQQKFKESRDPASMEILEQNLKLVEQKKERMDDALEEIRQKEGLLDLVYNSLVNVEEDLKFGRTVQRLLPPDLYRRFGLQPPGEQSGLPPLLERSDE